MQHRSIPNAHGAKKHAQCPYCHGPMDLAGLPAKEHCDRPECATRHRVAASAALAKKQSDAYNDWLQTTQRRVRPAQREAARRMGHASLRQVAYGIAPYIDVPVQPLEPARRADFEAHLTQIVTESFDRGVSATGPEDDPGYAHRRSEEAPEATALDASCIACQGDCCLQGGARKAFLKPKHIDYYRWREPEAKPEAILADYLSRIPDTSVSGSCVYHSAQGCVLPREMRAGICNSFQCRFRAALAEQLARKPETGAVVTGISHDHVKDRHAGAPYLRTVTVSAQGDVTLHDDLRLPGIRQRGAPSES